MEQLTHPEFTDLMPHYIQNDILFYKHWDKRPTRIEAERVHQLVSQSLPECEVELVGGL